MTAMTRTMTAAERANRDQALAREKRSLQRLHDRGPLDDPYFEKWMTGSTHSEKVAEIQDRIAKLAILR
jgi:hypothetical protein